MKKLKVTLWVFSCTGMVLISVIAFSPLVIPVGEYQPMFFGLPYTLWVGIATSVVMTFLTVVAAIALGYLSEDESI